MSANYSLNLIQTAAVSTKQVALIYIYMAMSSVSLFVQYQTKFVKQNFVKGV